MTERPSIVEDLHLLYLDDLRESGVTNMYGAGSYVEQTFSVGALNASIILTYWMESFSETHPDRVAAAEASESL